MIERRVWMSGELIGSCVIWYNGFPFWNLVTGFIGLKVDVIWGEDRIWISQAQRWWPDNQWIEGEREGDALCWKADWIITEDIQVPKVET